MKNIAISIIMPVYNTPVKYLTECLNSIFTQTFSDWELVIVDDGSDKRETLDVLNNIRNDKNVRCLHNSFSKGAGYSRNIGLKIAHGEYVIFLDSDDIFAEEMLDTLYRKAKDRKLDISGCTYELFNEEGVISKSDYLGDFLEDSDSELRLLSTAIAPWNKLYKKSYLTEIGASFQNISSCNDVAFFCYTMLCTNKIYIDYDKVFVKYRTQTTSQISSRRDPKNFYYAIKYAIKLFKEKSIYNGQIPHMIDALFVANAVSELMYSVGEENAREFYYLCQNYFVSHSVIFKFKRLKIYLDYFMREQYDSYWFLLLSNYDKQLKMNGLNLLKQLKNYDGKIYVWGTGKRGQAFFRWIKDYHINILGVCDKKNINIGDSILGIPIVDREEVLANSDLVVATNEIIYDELKDTVNVEIINLEEYCPL